MSKDNNLTDFLTDLADTIRDKAGTSGTIDPQDFSSIIANLPTGGDYKVYISTAYRNNTSGIEFYFSDTNFVPTHFYAFVCSAVNGGSLSGNRCFSCWAYKYNQNGATVSDQNEMDINSNGTVTLVTTKPTISYSSYSQRWTLNLNNYTPATVCLVISIAIQDLSDGKEPYWTL